MNSPTVSTRAAPAAVTQGTRLRAPETPATDAHGVSRTEE